MRINGRAVRILAALAMSVALTGCVGYVRDGSEPVAYMSGGYYYGSYYDGAYYRYYDRRGYDSRYVYAVPRAAAQPAPPAEKTFASPDEAVSALRAAVEAGDQPALKKIFGPEAGALLSGDAARDESNVKRLSKAMAESTRAVSERNGTMTLEIGRNKWPFPVPLVKEGSAWRFDTATGKEAIVNRRIGKGELHAIAVCRSFAAGGGPAPASYHGYLFKTAAGPDAGSYALTAYPELWGKSGIMTFVVDHDGKVYQRDLGEKTPELAAKIAQFDPRGDWAPVKDPGITEK